MENSGRCFTEVGNPVFHRRGPIGIVIATREGNRRIYYVMQDQHILCIICANPSFGSGWCPTTRPKICAHKATWAGSIDGGDIAIAVRGHHTANFAIGIDDDVSFLINYTDTIQLVKIISQIVFIIIFSASPRGHIQSGLRDVQIVWPGTHWQGWSP